MTSTKNIRIGDFCETGSGSTPSRDQIARYYDGGTIPWVKSGELRESTITSTDEHITEAALKETSVKLVPANALLVAMYGATVGRLGILGMPATTNQAVCHIVPDPSKADVKYLFRALETKVGEMLSRTVGGAQPNINQGIVKDLRVPLPPLEEQRRIAAILDQAETLRTQRRTALALLDSLTQSLFLDMFGDPVANPKGWPIQTLDEVTTKVTDGEHLNPAFTEVGMPIVMAGNVLDDRIDLDAAKRVAEPLGMQFRKKCGPELGDLLIVGRGATIGRLCRVNVEETFCLMGSVILVKPDRTLLDERFLSGMLALPSMHAQLYKSSGSSAQQAIYLKDVKRLKCPLPPLPLQQTFATRIASIEALKATHRRALAALDALFASLQQRAFAGQL